MQDKFDTTTNERVDLVLRPPTKEERTEMMSVVKAAYAEYERRGFERYPDIDFEGFNGHLVTGYIKHLNALNTRLRYLKTNPKKEIEMTKTKTAEPKVGAPGAGLPFVEWFVAKYIMFPSIYKNTSVKEAKNLYLKESNKILEIAKTLDDKQLSQRCLIPRLQGLEDNSRYWSVAMVIEHLNIVGSGIRATIIDLTEGGTTRKPVGIKDVKPNPAVDPQKAITEFEDMIRLYEDKISLENLENHPEATYKHPWFGPMNARQWYILSSRHQAIHRKQIQVIVDSLLQN